ncbi:MAG: hypothetical protein A2Y33_12770 [Spirochaetes bacterium GWF1_51_8]|nr:MAG: hypothetical protein A2Y33_12770 [Spirochaetes bacterium GWF1_51_8]
MNGVKEAYDRASGEYARLYFHELDDKPLDRDLLRVFLSRLRAEGTVCDLGCGPGEIAAFLRSEGQRDLIGIDLSSGMIEEARRLQPDVRFETGDMLALHLVDNSIAGIAAFYAIVTLNVEELAKAFSEMYRVLKPGGLLLISFHTGNEVVHAPDFHAQDNPLDFYFFEPDTIKDLIVRAGLQIEDLLVRDPYPDKEYPSKRCYLFARK